MRLFLSSLHFPNMLAGAAHGIKPTKVEMRHQTSQLTSALPLTDCWIMQVGSINPDMDKLVQYTIKRTREHPCGLHNVPRSEYATEPLFARCSLRSLSNQGQVDDATFVTSTKPFRTENSFSYCKFNYGHDSRTMIELGVIVNLEPGKEVSEQPLSQSEQATAFVRFVPGDLILEDGRTVESFAGGRIIYFPPQELVKLYEKHKYSSTWFKSLLSAFFSEAIRSRDKHPLSRVHCLRWMTHGVESHGLDTIVERTESNDLELLFNISFLQELDCGPNKISSGLIVTLCWAMDEDPPLNDAQQYSEHGVESLTYIVRNKLGWYFPYLIYDPFAQSPPEYITAALADVRNSMHTMQRTILQSCGYPHQTRYHNVLEFAIAKTIYIRSSVYKDYGGKRVSALQSALSRMNGDLESTDSSPFDSEIVRMLLGIAIGGRDTNDTETPTEIEDSVQRFSETLT
ncbi:hypothetical protein EDD36DRAFT_225536 [Exophiala viscosa]|uniref:Uncharacterized protein n=1 Tax=Exophiala viscosa TaxID=2486360 RepID=A0AAN6DY64_9EURO|nr:hypothetical protein EDD36DRAFT_225536 [Exophiala viscosa]